MMKRSKKSLALVVGDNTNEKPINIPQPPPPLQNERAVANNTISALHKKSLIQ